MSRFVPECNGVMTASMIVLQDADINMAAADGSPSFYRWEVDLYPLQHKNSPIRIA